MKAAVLHRPHDIRLETWPMPRIIRPDQVLIRVTHVGVCGSDVHYYQDGRIGDMVVKSPLVLGHEFAGMVEKAGAAVKHLKKGDQVAVEPGVPCGTCEFCRTDRYNLCRDIVFCGSYPAQGCYLEYKVYNADYVCKLPAGITLAEGAMLEPLAVSLHAVNLAALRAAQTIVVLGAGSIGLTCLQILRMNRGHRIFVTDKLDYRLRLAKRFGADAVINVPKKDPVAEVLRLTNGRGADLVFEAAGADETQIHAQEMARPGGEVVLIGIPASDRIAFKAGTVRRKELTIKYVRRMKGTYPQAIDLVARGLVNVKALVTHTFALKDIAKAFKLVERYGDGVVKVVIKI
jgi:L-iditol 2-dehydrogenase